MVKSVYVPEAGGILDFADDITPQEISSYINSKYPRAAAPAAAPTPDESSLAQRFTYGLVGGITDIPGGIASLMYPAEEAGQTWGGRFSAGNRAYLERQLNIDPTKELTTGQMLAQGLGSAASFLVPGGAAAKGASLAGMGLKGAARLGTATAATQGVAVGAESRAGQIRQQLSSGMQISESDQLAAQRLSGLIGASEALPMGKFFAPLNTILSKVPASKAALVEKIISNRLAKITKASAQEAAQEVASGIANDLMEYGVYNPDVQVGQDILSNAGTGAFAGGVLEGIIQLAAGRKLRGARQLQKDLAAEKQVNAAELRQAYIAQDADSLLASGVRGEVSISEEEDPAGFTKFVLKDITGSPVAEYESLDAAEKVIDLYKQKSGIEVSIRKPGAEPPVAPGPSIPPAPKVELRLGKRKFASMDDVVAERKKYSDEVAKINVFKSNPSLLIKEAESQGVAPGVYAKDLDIKLAKNQAEVAKYDEFIKSLRQPPVEPIKAPETAATPKAEVKPSVGAIREKEQEVAADAFTEAEAPEPVAPETVEPEMPIGSVEMPIEESRVLPDAIVDYESKPIPVEATEEAPTQTVSRPSATDEQLTALKVELFGEPLGYRQMTPEQLAAYEAERDKRFPPEDVNIPLSAGITGQTTPRNMKEAAVSGPVVRDYSPETQEWMRKVYDGLMSRLSPIVPTEASVNLKTLIDMGPGYLIRGQARPEQTPDGMKTVIDLSTGILRPGMSVEDAINALADTMNHEIIHVLRDKGVIRASEWRILSRAATTTNVPGKSYTYLDKAQAIYAPIGPNGEPVPMAEIYANPEAVVEEAVAEMYRNWVKDRAKPPQPAVGLFNRITEFFRRIFQTLRNARHQDVFEAIQAGEIGRREGEGRERAQVFSASPIGGPGGPMSTDLNSRGERAFGLYPYLRTAAPRYYDHNRKILGATNPGNAAAQISNLDGLLARHRNTLASDQAFAEYLADAMGKMATPETGVPMVPYAAVMHANNPDMIARQLGRMTPGQLQMAEEGLSAAKDFENAYRSGTATPVQTAKLILWGILSRGVSPFVQESMFLDVVKPVGVSNRTGQVQGGIDQFINDAVNGEFDLDSYMDYVRTLKIDGLPGAGTTHNLGAFGKTTLVKLQQRVPDGRTILQYLHDLISDYSLSGKEIRRRFHEVNPGIGINNKVLSFMMLVSGRDDVLVLDRVQMRNQFNNGLFDDYNLYDGEKIEREVTKTDGSKKVENVTDPGTGIAPIGDGVFGLMYYEALERDLAKAVRQAYNMLGRGNQFSMGRYHWESWVATSSQEVDHGSVTGLIKEATGEADPYAGIYTGEGKYDTFNSGIRYGYTRDGEAYVALPDGSGKYYFFTPEFAKKVIKGYSRTSTGIIRDGTFKVSESTEGPWYDRPEVNKERLRQYLRAQTEVFRNERRDAFSKRLSEIGESDPTRPGPGPVHAVRRRGGVRQPYVTHPKEPAKGVRFSAAPAVDSAEFKKWFGKSVAVNLDGTPTRYYHGTPFSFKEFGKGRSGSVAGESGPFYFSTSPKYANQYAETKIYAGGDGSDVKKGGKVFPVYISAQNPFDYENPKHVERLREFVRAPLPKIEEGFWKTIENPVTQRAIRDLGFDGFYLDEAGFKNLAVYKPEQVKSIFNQFPEGEATRARFSAAPLPPYVERQNENLFAPTPKISYRDMMFDWFFGHRNTGKTLSTMNGTVDISKSTMAGLSAKSAAVDKGAYITHLESLLNQQQTGNFQRMAADYSATAALAWRRRSGHLTASMMLRGKLEVNFERPGDIQSATMKVTDDPDSLKEIFKVMTEPGPEKADGTPTTKADIFKSYAVALRGEWLRSTGQTVPAAITPQYIRETVDFTRREYPEVVEAYNKYQRFNKNLLSAAKDAGIISQAELGRLTNQMNYYGFIYEAYGEPLGPTSAQKTASKFKLRPYTGAQYGGLTNDPMFVMIQNAQFWVDSIAKNLAATKAYKVANTMGEARPLRSDESPNEMAGEAPDVMYYSEAGVVKKFAVKDPLLVAALGSDDRINVGKFWEALGLPAHVLRESVTRDPGFMARNLMRDTVAAWMNSGVDFVPVIDTIRGFATALKGGASFEALSARGVVGSYDLAMMGPQEIAETFRRSTKPINVHTITSVEGGSAAIRSLWNRLGNLSEASDAATRIAVYDACKAQGMSDAEAAMQAIELLDFTRRGGSQTLGILTKLIPFLNARIQGMDVLYQAGRAGIRAAGGANRGERDANIGKKFLIRGGMLAALSVGLEMLNDDDEDYKQLDDYIKNGNLLIPLKQFGLEGEFLAIPKPFENGLIFSTIPQQIYKTMVGDASTRDNVNLFFEQFGSTFGVNPIPQALLPPIEMITNHNFYTGLPLISEGKQRLAPELQYNTNTSQIAMLLGGLPIYYDFTTGRFGGASPIMIDKVISGYGGPIGTYLVQGASLLMQDAEIGPERMPIDLSNAPVVKSFFIDAKSKNPRVVTQAYELFRVADEVNRTYSRLKQTGDTEALMEYVGQNRDIMTYKKYIFKLADRLNKLSAQERAIERDSTMTPDQKIEAQRRLRDIRIRLSAQVFDINQKLGR